MPDLDDFKNLINGCELPDVIEQIAIAGVRIIGQDLGELEAIKDSIGERDQQRALGINARLPFIRGTGPTLLEARQLRSCAIKRLIELKTGMVDEVDPVAAFSQAHLQAATWNALVFVNAATNGATEIRQRLAVIMTEVGLAAHLVGEDNTDNVLNAADATAVQTIIREKLTALRVATKTAAEAALAGATIDQLKGFMEAGGIGSGAGLVNKRNHLGAGLFNINGAAFGNGLQNYMLTDAVVTELYEYAQTQVQAKITAAINQIGEQAHNAGVISQAEGTALRGLVAVNPQTAGDIRTFLYNQRADLGTLQAELGVFNLGNDLNAAQIFTPAHEQAVHARVQARLQQLQHAACTAAEGALRNDQVTVATLAPFLRANTPDDKRTALAGGAFNLPHAQVLSDEHINLLTTNAQHLVRERLLANVTHLSDRPDEIGDQAERAAAISKLNALRELVEPGDDGVPAAIEIRRRLHNTTQGPLNDPLQLGAQAFAPVVGPGAAAPAAGPADVLSNDSATAVYNAAKAKLGPIERVLMAKICDKILEKQDEGNMDLSDLITRTSTRGNANNARTSLQDGFQVATETAAALSDHQIYNTVKDLAVDRMTLIIKKKIGRINLAEDAVGRGLLEGFSNDVQTFQQVREWLHTNQRAIGMLTQMPDPARRRPGARLSPSEQVIPNDEADEIKVCILDRITQHQAKDVLSKIAAATTYKQLIGLAGLTEDQGQTLDEKIKIVLFFDAALEITQEQVDGRAQEIAAARRPGQLVPLQVRAKGSDHFGIHAYLTAQPPQGQAPPTDRQIADYINNLGPRARQLIQSSAKDRLDAAKNDVFAKLKHMTLSELRLLFENPRDPTTSNISYDKLKAALHLSQSTRNMLHPNRGRGNVAKEARNLIRAREATQAMWRTAVNRRVTTTGTDAEKEQTVGLLMRTGDIQEDEAKAMAKKLGVDPDLDGKFTFKQAGEDKYSTTTMHLNDGSILSRTQQRNHTARYELKNSRGTLLAKFTKIAQAAKKAMKEKKLDPTTELVKLDGIIPATDEGREKCRQAFEAAGMNNLEIDGQDVGVNVAPRFA